MPSLRFASSYGTTTRGAARRARRRGGGSSGIKFFLLGYIFTYVLQVRLKEYAIDRNSIEILSSYLLERSEFKKDAPSYELFVRGSFI